jgi:hypothetical protein
MFQVSGRLDLQTASQAQFDAAVDATVFSVSANSGFCLAAMAPAAPTVILFNGAERTSSESLFDADTGANGLASSEGRRSFVRTTGPIDETSFLLSTLVAQTPTAPGSTAIIFVRVYPDTTPVAALDGICGPPKMFPPAAAAN